MKLIVIDSVFSAVEGGDVITMFRFTTTTTPHRTFSTPDGGECTASRPLPQLPSYVLGIPNYAYTTLSQILIGRSIQE